MELIFLPFFALAALAGAFVPSDAGQSGANAMAAGVFVVMGLAAPVMYGVFGFIFGIISAALYNLVARWVGGIEVEVD